MKVKLVKGAVWALPLLGMFASSGVWAMANSDLASIHDAVELRYRSVTHMSPEALASMTTNEVLLFDVREQSEFDVSHLEGAVRISPDLSGDDFLETYGTLANGKTVVFYCSVGYRSSKMANRVQKEFASADTAKIYNLQGGIFGWHNEQRSLVNRDGATDFVHPYDTSWAGLIERAEQIRYFPEGGAP